MRKLIGVTLAVLALGGMSGCIYSSSVKIADPGVWRFGDKYYIASSDTNGPGSGGDSLAIYSLTTQQVQNQGSTPQREGQVFLPGQEPGWVDRNRPLWAPEIKTINGHVIAYYSAGCKGPGTQACLLPGTNPPIYTSHRCIGMAIALNGIKRNTGFSPLGNPFCSPGNYDLIDPTTFTDGDGSNYLLFKQDPAGSTKHIAITRLDANGFNPSFATKQILHAGQAWETTQLSAQSTYTSVEAPTMIRKGDLYYLFYSGSFYKSKRYGVGVARCRASKVGETPMGCDFNDGSYKGWEYTGNPILGGDTTGYCGVGHQDVSDGGAGIWYHLYGTSDCSDSRSLGAQPLQWGSDDWPHPKYGRSP